MSAFEKAFLAAVLAGIVSGLVLFFIQEKTKGQNHALF